LRSNGARKTNIGCVSLSGIGYRLRRFLARWDFMEKQRPPKGIPLDRHLCHRRQNP
jgi:hypothetical protein